MKDDDPLEEVPKDELAQELLESLKNKKSQDIAARQGKPPIGTDYPNYEPYRTE